MIEQPENIFRARNAAHYPEHLAECLFGFYPGEKDIADSTQLCVEGTQSRTGFFGEFLIVCRISAHLALIITRVTSSSWGTPF